MHLPLHTQRCHMLLQPHTLIPPINWISLIQPRLIKQFFLLRTIMPHIQPANKILLLHKVTSTLSCPCLSSSPLLTHASSLWNNHFHHFSPAQTLQQCTRNGSDNPRLVIVKMGFFPMKINLSPPRDVHFPSPRLQAPYFMLRQSLPCGPLRVCLAATLPSRCGMNSSLLTVCDACTFPSWLLPSLLSYIFYCRKKEKKLLFLSITADVQMSAGLFRENWFHMITKINDDCFFPRHLY